MDHVAHVGLVHAHAERNRRDHHGRIRLQELVEPCRSQILVESCVIGERRHACRGQLFRQPVHPVARTGIDDAGAPRPLGNQFQHAPVSLTTFALCREGKLGPREAVHKLPRVFQLKLAADVVARARIGRGGDGEPRNAWKHLGQPAQHPVLGSEIVPPLAHAMRLVDRDQCER